MNKKDIVEAIHATVGFPKRETTRIVDKALEIMKTTLIEGESVMISRFGNFSVREKRARKGRNPKTGETITIPARKVVTFKVSRALKERVDGAHRDRDTG
ncbi:MAG: integration host factor subunit alpha [Deltaproteobacteria bacterium]|nr:integration host factor subunit alpha [Deltaproteobacteria bacterium]